MSNLNKLAQEMHENGRDKGFWRKEMLLPELIALRTSELSEALEEGRKGKEINEIYYNKKVGESIIGVPVVNCSNCNLRITWDHKYCPHCGVRFDDKKPEGIPVELADCIIRILDFCGKHKIDIDNTIKIKHEYNKTREYMHGKKY